jgi:hypothetical protein
MEKTIICPLTALAPHSPYYEFGPFTVGPSHERLEKCIKIQYSMTARLNTFS